MRLPLIVMLIALNSYSSVHALALGQISMHSFYNEPLDATIPLIELHGDTGSDVDVAIADKLAFASAGLERNSLLDEINVSLERNAQNEQFIQLRSTRVVRDLYLDFIIDVSSNEERLSRNITVLVDPRTYANRLATVTPRPVRKSTVSRITLPKDTGTQSHSMESHSMEATLDKGKESHSMESHSMEATLDKGKESHSMESHSMEATLDKGKESHSMESHSMEATLDTGKASHSMEAHSK